MNIDRSTVDRLVKDKSWKGHLTTGIILLVICAIVTSPIFTVMKALLEMVLLFGGSGFLIWAAYQYMQLYEKKK